MAVSLFRVLRRCQPSDIARRVVPRVANATQLRVRKVRPSLALVISENGIA